MEVGSGRLDELSVCHMEEESFACRRRITCELTLVIIPVTSLQPGNRAVGRTMTIKSCHLWLITLHITTIHYQSTFSWALITCPPKISSIFKDIKCGNQYKLAQKLREAHLLWFIANCIKNILCESQDLYKLHHSYVACTCGCKRPNSVWLQSTPSIIQDHLHALCTY